jgi:hypothetical protein
MTGKKKWQWMAVGAVASAAFLFTGCAHERVTGASAQAAAFGEVSKNTQPPNPYRDPGIYEEPGTGLPQTGVGGVAAPYAGHRVGNANNHRASNSVDVLSQWSRVNSWDSSTRTNLPVRNIAAPPGGADGINNGPTQIGVGAGANLRLEGPNAPPQGESNGFVGGTGG